MWLHDLLDDACMLFLDAGAEAGRDAVLRQLTEAMCRKHRLDVERVCADVDARERQGTTFVKGQAGAVSLPHALTPACRQLLLGLAVSPHGVPWGEETEERAQCVFLLLGPPQGQALYLRVIGRLARLSQGREFVAALAAATTAEQVRATVRAAEEPLGPMAVAEGQPSFCVVGAGHGGMAMAGHLALLGCRVNLLNRSPGRIAPVQVREGIEVTGEVHGFARLGVVTTDPAAALADVDVVMVVTPATGHRTIANLIAPHVKDGQIVVLNPGRTGGALEVSRIFQERNPGVSPYVAEAQTLLYAARVTNPGQVHIFGIKNSVPLATLPAYHVTDVLPVVRKALPQFVPGDNVLRTSLDNIGAVFHPAITILNAGRIEDTHGDFEYYVEGVTPAVATILEAVDRERVSVAEALGIRVSTAREWLYLAYDAAGRTLLDAMRANPGYSGIRAPGTIMHRYISEDVPASLVPLASIGDMLGVPTPTIKAMIQMASVMHGVDYWREGRTVERLGLAGLSVKGIRFLVVGARVPPPAPAENGEE